MINAGGGIVTIQQKESTMYPKEMVRLYWIGVGINRKTPKVRATNNYTPQGQRIMEGVIDPATGDSVFDTLPVTFAVRDVIYTAPPIGGFLEITEDIAVLIENQMLLWGADGNEIPAFTRDPDYADLIKKAVDEGRPIPLRTYDAIAQSIEVAEKRAAEVAVSNLTVEELQALLAQRQVSAEPTAKKGADKEK